MDPSASASASTPRNDVPAVVVKSEDRSRPVFQQQPPTQAHRQVRYKDRFQTLRERYDQVTTMHEDYERLLSAAFEKERKLQLEIDSLLDVWVPDAKTQTESSAYDPSYRVPTSARYPYPAEYVQPSEYAQPPEYAYNHNHNILNPNQTNAHARVGHRYSNGNGTNNGHAEPVWHAPPEVRTYTRARDCPTRPHTVQPPADSYR
ncbi:hypothetical protein EW146_g9006 [Bondarzewia mesenterica]|uniref:Uncharacterized protein n=1 Tax=Bondarzewia mesenterica TaxID=1095465 RepID=A0A4S4LA02_9AGAM|nr:hypothetical protein EW146_g9006 [Bondarzewia mesenterica]